MKENTSSGAKTSEKKNRREKNKIIGTIRQGGCAGPIFVTARPGGKLMKIMNQGKRE